MGIWTVASEAQFLGWDKAQQTSPTVGRDSRPCLRAVHQLFTGKTNEDIGSIVESLERVANGAKYAESDDHEHDSFYSSLYLSIYFGTIRETGQAKFWINKAVSM